MIARLINPQGIAGIAVSLSLAILLGLQKMQTHHWQTQSGEFEQLYRTGQATLTATVANYRAAAETARATDLATWQRVAAEQHVINERSQNAFETRVADARSRAAAVATEQLRLKAANRAANSGGGPATPVPDLSTPASSPDEASGQDRLSSSDALTATEQAIQLDELIKWVKAQVDVEPNARVPD